MDAAGLPPGIVNLVHGDRGTAEHLLSDPNIDGATLTGSSRAGFAAQVICMRRRIPFQGELGGNNAAIVWSDADLGQAAALIALGGFGSAGQRCTATRRVIVDRECSGKFLDQFQEAVSELSWGDPLNERTRVGPVISKDALRRIAGVVDRARAAGATVLTPHASAFPAEVGPGGFYFPPTIVCCRDPAAEIVLEETFGPVVVVQEANSWEHALDLCNGVSQGLVASLFSSSAGHAREFLAEARAGLLKINTPTAGAAADAPFCGWKGSGVGPPEHGVADIEFYSRWQTVYRSETQARQLSP
jgi:aldehyde dehydrogenase (NAD+)